MQRKLTPRQKQILLQRRKRLRRRRRIKIALLILAAVAVIAVLLVLILRPGSDGAASLPTAGPTVEITREPTPEPTPEITQAPTPTPQPIPIGLYAPDGNGVRYLLSEFVSNWQRGKDIDCFEALVSDAPTLTGKNFYSICKACWGTLPDPYTMKIGYTLRYTLTDGQEISMTIRRPGDITHTEYVECYLYDDVHQFGGFYTHLSDSGMKDNTLITSIKITCGDLIAQVQEMRLGVFLYDSESQFDAAGNYTGAWYNEINIRRKA